MSAAIMDELVRHKWHANAAYLAAVCGNETASQDEELRKLFHHILFSNRFWLFLAQGREFDREKESQIPDALDVLVDGYKETAALEVEWMSHLDDSEWNRQVATPRLPGQTFTVAEALMQTCLHSHGHRVQSAGRLRSLGGTPPRTELALWLKDKAEPEWPSSASRQDEPVGGS